MQQTNRYAKIHASWTSTLSALTPWPSTVPQPAHLFSPLDPSGLKVTCLEDVSDHGHIQIHHQQEEEDEASWRRQTNALPRRWHPMGGSGGWASENVLELTPDSAGTVMKPSIGL